MNLHFDNKTELLDKIAEVRTKVNEADQQYQFAFARADYKTCGKFSNERAIYRNQMAKLLKYKIKKGWL
jgi:hypothetical protein|tara:strand:+ start:182 stop:388 length:207 start_codon:yes stop_codon:yes gene_type:complete